MLTKNERMKVLMVENIVYETPDVITIYLPSMGNAQPGQYIMVWLPGVDEVPMSLSSIGEMFSISVRVVGEATKALFALKRGDKLGVRGPFGNGYVVVGKKPLLVGGGMGIASLTPLAEEMSKKGIKPTFLLGARSSDQLLFRTRLEKLLDNNLVVSTNDGSVGYHGYASDYAGELMSKNRFDHVFVCGPELMLTKIYSEVEKRGLPIQASLERFCKCSIGLCGSCAIGPYRVCVDGPVFNSAMLLNIREDLGKRRRDSSGRIIKVDH